MKLRFKCVMWVSLFMSLCTLSRQLEAQTEALFDVTSYSGADPAIPLVYSYADPDDDTNDDGPGIQAAIDAAVVYTKANPTDTAKVWLPLGSTGNVYDIKFRWASGSDRSLYLYDAPRVRIVGEEGVILRFWLRDVFGIKVYKSSDVEIRNLIFEYKTRAFTQGVITAVSSTTVDFSVDSGYPDPLTDSLFDVDIASSHERSIQAFDPDSKLIKRASRQLSLSSVDPGTGGDVRLTTKTYYNPVAENFEVGDLITFKGSPPGSARSILYVTASDDVTLSGLTIYDSGSTGITNSGCLDVTIDSCNIVPRDDGLLSSNRGAIRNDLCRGNLTVTNCDIDRCGDDGITTPSKFATVTTTGNSTLLYADRGDAKSGETIEIFDSVTHASLGTRVLVSDPTETSPDIWEYTLNSAIAVEIGDLVQPSSRVAYHFEISNNRIRRHRARGLLLKSSYGIADNNVIDGSTYAGIVMGPEFSIYSEAGFVRDVCITNNKIRNVGYSSAAAVNSNTFLGAITVSEKSSASTWPTGRENQRILIQGNEVVSSGLCGLFLGSVSGAEVKDNRFVNCQMNVTPTAGSSAGIPYTTDPLDTPFYLIETEDIQFSNNSIEWDEGDSWIRSPSSSAYDYVGTQRELFYNFEAEEGFPAVFGATALTSIPSSNQSATLTATDFKLIGNNGTYPYYVDLQTARCDDDDGQLVINVNNPRSLRFKLSSNTSTTDTWDCVVSVENLDRTDLGAVELDRIRNSSCFHATGGQAPNFKSFEFDLSEEVTGLPQIGRWRITITRENLPMTSSSPYMYVDDLGVSYESMSTGFEVAQGLPATSGNYYMATGGPWQPSTLIDGLDLEFEDSGLVSLSPQRLGTQGSRNQKKDGSISILGVDDPFKIGFKLAVSDPVISGEPAGVTNDVAVQVRPNSGGSWSQIGLVSSSTLSSLSSWEFAEFEFPLGVAVGNYDVRIVRLGDFSTNIYNYVCIDNLFLRQGTSFSASAYPCPPWN